jgi:hypothetical protein
MREASHGTHHYWSLMEIHRSRRVPTRIRIIGLSLLLPVSPKAPLPSPLPAQALSPQLTPTGLSLSSPPLLHQAAHWQPGAPSPSLPKPLPHRAHPRRTPRPCYETPPHLHPPPSFTCRALSRAAAVKNEVRRENTATSACEEVFYHLVRVTACSCLYSTAIAQ